MGNSVVVNCCRRVTNLLYPARGCSPPDERSPLLLKAPVSGAGSVDALGASWGSAPFPDVITSAAAGGGLQEHIECAQALPEAEGEAAVATACSNSCSGAGSAAPLPATVLPADLEEGPLELLGCAVLPVACQGHVKPEDCGVACSAGPGAACGALTCSVQPAGPRPGAASLLGNGSQRAASSESPNKARSARTGRAPHGHGVAAPSALSWEKASGRRAVCSRNPSPPVQLSKQQKRRKKRKLLLLEHLPGVALVNGSGPHENLKGEKDARQNGHEEADAGEDGNDQEVIVIQDTGFTVKICAPGIEPFSLQVSPQEMVQEIHQVLMDREDTCHRTCFSLQLDGNVLDNFAELKTIEGLQEGSLLKVVEEPYTVREARIHVRHIRDLLKSLDPSDAFNGVDCNSLSFLSVFTEGDLGDSGKRKKKGTEMEQIDCTPPEHILPGSKERPLCALQPQNRDWKVEFSCAIATAVGIYLAANVFRD